MAVWGLAERLRHLLHDLLSLGGGGIPGTLDLDVRAVGVVLPLIERHAEFGIKIVQDASQLIVGLGQSGDALLHPICEVLGCVAHRHPSSCDPAHRCQLVNRRT